VGGLDFSAIGGKIQRHGSALIGAGLKTPNKIGAGDIFDYNHLPLCSSSRPLSKANH
jgi:hypothetical protein